MAMPSGNVVLSDKMHFTAPSVGAGAGAGAVGGGAGGEIDQGVQRELHLEIQNLEVRM